MWCMWHVRCVVYACLLSLSLLSLLFPLCLCACAFVVVVVVVTRAMMMMAVLHCVVASNAARINQEQTQLLTQLWCTRCSLPPSLAPSLLSMLQPARLSKNRKKRGHVSAGHGRVGMSVLCVLCPHPLSTTID